MTAFELEAAATPRRLSRQLANQLIALADPEATLAPARPSMADADSLLSQAERHRVLPGVLRRLRPVLSGDLAPLREQYTARFSAGVAFRMMLKAETARILTALRQSGVPAVMIKGLDFAENLYPDPLLRAAGDIDLIVPNDRMDEADQVLAGLGYRQPPDCPVGGIERKWLHTTYRNLMVEVQGNLVHPGSLGSVLSLGFEELCPDGNPGAAARPSARLVIAGMHAASSHHFESLRLVVDVLQAARRLDTAAEEQALEGLIRRSGARLPVVASLDLAYRLYREPRCKELATLLRPARYSAVARLLIDQNVVMSMETEQRARQSWRRSLFRELLKRSAGAEGIARL